MRKVTHKATAIALAGLGLYMLGIARPVRADITTTGQVSHDPSTTTEQQDLTIAAVGTGTMTINGGSDVVSRTSNLGVNLDSVGQVTIDGTGSTWSAADLTVGTRGNGLLMITNGGLMHNAAGLIATHAESISTVTVDGGGSTWTSLHEIVLGNTGNGTLTITNGGNASGETTSLGNSSGGVGEITVDGTDSAFTTEHLHVGYAGQGTLNIANNGQVHVTERDTWVGKEPGAIGTINFNGGALNTTGINAAPSELHGTGTINANGIISDISVSINQNQSLQQQFMLNDGSSQNITVNLDVNGLGSLGSGYRGEGFLSISDGIVAQSTEGYVGYHTGSSGAVTVDGIGTRWTNSKALQVGYYGHGELEITYGARVSNHTGYAAFWENATAEITVDGPGSTWANSANLYLGYYGNATLDITDGGKVNNDTAYLGRTPGALARVTVDGEGSTWTNRNPLNIGYEGEGSLTITNGGTVTSPYATAGGNEGSTGQIFVDGSSSSLDVIAELTIGSAGNGSISITNGATVHSSGGTIASASQVMGQAMVDGPGSTWNMDASLRIGTGGRGILSITNGGYVSSTYGMIGRNDDNEQGGVVYVDGKDSTWIANGHLYIGYYSKGVINITNNALVEVAGTTLTNYDPRGSGVINLAGGTLRTARISLADVADFNWTSGTFHLTDSSVYIETPGIDHGSHAYNLTADFTLPTEKSLAIGDIENSQRHLYIGGNGSDGVFHQNGGNVSIINGDMVLGAESATHGTYHLTEGTLDLGENDIILGSGTGTFNFTGGRLANLGTIDLGVALIQSNGTLAPGNSLGTTTLVGGYYFDDGVLEIDLANLDGPGVGHDLVNVIGVVNFLDDVDDDNDLNSDLHVILDFAPALGDSFTILTNDDIDPIVGMFNDGLLTSANFENFSYLFSIDYASGDGNDISLTLVDIQAIPEPTSALLITGLSAILIHRRRGR